MKKRLTRMLMLFIPVALAIANASVNSPSLIIYHQPSIPKEILKQKKF